jgi:hypothetical protein
MKLEDLTNKAEKRGLIINMKKTKALWVNTIKTYPLTLRGESIDDVDSFIYLGSMVAKDGELCRMFCDKFEKQMVLSYNSTQCGKTAEYLLGPNSASSAVMLSRCCYMDLRHGK